MQEPTGDFPTRYELDISKGIVKSDGPEDHARLIQAIEACAGQVFSDTTIGCLIADCCSKALGGKLPNLECSRTLL